MRLTGLLMIAAIFSGRRDIAVDAAKNCDQKDFQLAQSKAEEIVDEFAKHPANNHEFFDWFPKEVEKGFSQEQFESFRDNYEFRTAGTFFSVIQKAIHAAKKGDYKFLPYIMQNAQEEGGNVEGGIISPAHMGMCEEAFNSLGSKVFDSNPVRVNEISTENSKYLLKAATEFRDAQERIYKIIEKDPTNEKITGRYLAHETAASNMLHVFEELFVSYKGYFTESEYEKMTQYFRAHIPESKEELGVEDRHGSDAILVAASSLCGNLGSKVEEEIREGGKEMLDAQNNLWSAMLQELKELSKDGEKIKPKRGNFKQQEHLPSTVISEAEAKDIVNTKVGKEL